jgi:electron transfer flavoprotein beta subunit
MNASQGEPMKIVVLVKEVPDTYGDRKLDLETGLAERSASERVLDEIGERALRWLCRTPTPTPARRSLSSRWHRRRRGHHPQGARDGRGIRSAGRRPGAGGADLGVTAAVLAAAVRRAGFDLVITGNLSTDGTGGVLPAMIAEHLQVPQATALSSVTIGEGEITGTRATDFGTAQVSATLPAVISITEALPDARFPNFKGIMAAKKKPFETVSLADLGVDVDPSAAAQSIMTAVAEKPRARESRSSMRATRATSSPPSSSRTDWPENGAGNDDDGERDGGCRLGRDSRAAGCHPGR